MTKAFENKVRKYGRVDTRNYRYMVREHEGIVRIKIEYLDTMAAYAAYSIQGTPPLLFCNYFMYIQILPCYTKCDT